MRKKNSQNITTFTDKLLTITGIEESTPTKEMNGTKGEGEEEAEVEGNLTTERISETIPSKRSGTKMSKVNKVLTVRSPTNLRVVFKESRRSRETKSRGIKCKKSNGRGNS